MAAAASVLATIQGRRSGSHPHHHRSSFLRDGGVLNQRRIQAQVVKFVFLSLGDKTYYPRGLLDPIIEMARDLILTRASTRTLRRWYNHFLKHGELPAETRKASHIRITCQLLWTNDDTISLQQIVDDHSYYYLDEIHMAMLGMTGKKFSCSLLWSRLTDKKSGLNYSLQVVTRIAGQRDEDEWRQYTMAISTFALHPSMLLFLDETAKYRNSAQRHRHWSLRNCTPIVSELFCGSHGKQYSMLASCDWNGFVISSCQDVLREEDGTADQEKFTDWVETKLVPVLGSYEQCEPRSLVILDNASIHHSDEIVALIESTGAKVMYLPPYSPDLNPNELMFGEYKAALKRHHNKHWADAHMLGLYTVKPEHARGYFRKCMIPQCEKFNTEEEEKEASEAASCIGGVLAAHQQMMNAALRTAKHPV
jgi:DDE superfamily endonuclease